MKNTRHLLSWENGKGSQKRASLEDAKSMLKEMSAEWVIPRADRLVREEIAEWVYDPEVEETFGLVLAGTNVALVVIYGPIDRVIGRERWDFELTDKFLEDQS